MTEEIPNESYVAEIVPTITSKLGIDQFGEIIPLRKTNKHGIWAETSKFYISRE